MIRRSLLAAAALLAIGTAATSAAAQSIDSPYRFVENSQGFYLFGAQLFTDRGTIDIGPAGGLAAGFGYHVRISGPFNFAFRATYFPTDRRVYDDNSTLADSAALRADPMTGLEQVGTATLDMVLLDGSLRFDVTGPRTWHWIQPYALIGVGGVLVTGSVHSGEDNLPTDRELRVRFRNGFTGHVGAGIEVHLSERFTLRADARDLLWRLRVPEGFRATGRVIDENEWVQTAHLALGLTFRF